MQLHTCAWVCMRHINNYHNDCTMYTWYIYIIWTFCGWMVSPFLFALRLLWISTVPPSVRMGSPHWDALSTTHVHISGAVMSLKVTASIGGGVIETKSTNNLLKTHTHTQTTVFYGPTPRNDVTLQGMLFTSLYYSLLLLSLQDPTLIYPPVIPCPSSRCFSETSN